MGGIMIIDGVSIPSTKVIPTDPEHGELGHDFLLEAKLRVDKEIHSKQSWIRCPELEWKELVDWFDHSGEKWHYAGQSNPHGYKALYEQGYEDLYAKNPTSDTFGPWKARYSNAAKPANNPPQGLRNAVRGLHGEECEEEANYWIATHGFKWTLNFIDALKLGRASGGTNWGGAGGTLVTSNTRRRVTYLDVGFKGSPIRATATQVLEMVDGKPTIQSFFVPAISKDVANKSENLKKWRDEYTDRVPVSKTFRPLKGPVQSRLERRLRTSPPARLLLEVERHSGYYFGTPSTNFS